MAARNLLSVNAHIEHLLEKHQEIMDEGVPYMMEDANFSHDIERAIREFSAYTHMKLVTQYCQERLYMFHRYDMRGILFRSLADKPLNPPTDSVIPN